MITRRKILSNFLTIIFIISFVGQTFAAVTLPSISSITCYTLNSSGKVYAYTANDLKKKTGGYIDCSTDECQILKVSGNALQVKYPTGKTTKTAWFKRSEFTSCDISKREAAEKWTQANKITTYIRSDGKTNFGSVSKDDVCYKLTSKGKYTQILYPISGEKKYKMGWVKTSDIKKKGNDNKSKKALADVAENEVGYQGTNKNGKGKGDYTKYGKFTGANGEPWCASFVSWCANQAGISTKKVSCEASCDNMKNNSNSYKKWSSSALNSIKKNDVIFFANSPKANSSFHVGIVYKVSGNEITVIEGNTGNYYGPDTVAKVKYTVDSSSGKITKGYNGKYFCGYISV